MMFSVSMLTPIIITLIYEDGNWSSFLYSFLLTFFAGIITWFPSRNSVNDLKLRDGFVVVAMFWIVLGLFGAAPFYYSAVPDMSLTDSIFESMSGLTTTGATVITGLDFLPKSILQRCFLTWAISKSQNFLSPCVRFCKEAYILQNFRLPGRASARDAYRQINLAQP